MSDSHCQHRKIKVPDGDVFIHAGDFTCVCKETDVRDFAAWLRTLPHKHKLVIAGNHDVAFERNARAARTWLGDSCTYLQDDAIEIDGVLFYGSPWQPEFNNWAFNLPRGRALAEKWARIPRSTDVLITHGPPRGIFDAVGEEHVGCEALLEVVRRVRPKVHIFGHIHGAGQAEVDGTRFVNASVVVDPHNRLVAGCTVIDL